MTRYVTEEGHVMTDYMADYADDLGGSQDAITLNDALKLSGLAPTGGQAKLLIQSGQVSVNGETETRRKRKLREGDVVRVGEDEFVLELDAEEALGEEGL